MAFQNPLSNVGFGHADYSSSYPEDVKPSSVEDAIITQAPARFSKEEPLFIASDEPSAILCHGQTRRFARAKDLCSSANVASSSGDEIECVRNAPAASASPTRAADPGP